MSPLKLPRKLVVALEGCKGVLNAWYSNGKVTLCYEYIAYIEAVAANGNPPAGLPRDDVVVGPFLHVVLHEVAHAIFDILTSRCSGVRKTPPTRSRNSFCCSSATASRAGRCSGRFLLRAKSQGQVVQGQISPTSMGPTAALLQRLLCIAYGSDPNYVQRFHPEEAAAGRPQSAAAGVNTGRSRNPSPSWSCPSWIREVLKKAASPAGLAQAGRRGRHRAARRQPSSPGLAHTGRHRPSWRPRPGSAGPPAPVALPVTCRIGTAERAGTFHSQGHALKAILDRRPRARSWSRCWNRVPPASRTPTGCTRAISTSASWPRTGSVARAHGEAPFLTPIELRMVAPMNAGPLFFIVRAEASIRSVADLAGPAACARPKDERYGPARAQHLRCAGHILLRILRRSISISPRVRRRSPRARSMPSSSVRSPTW